MAKTTGLGWTTYTIQDAGLVARDVRSSVNDLDFSTPYDVQECTGLNKDAVERLALLADLKGSTSGTFDPGANLMHDVMKGDLRIPRVMVIGIAGASFTNTVLFTEYSLTRSDKGAFTTKHPFVLANGTVPTWA